MYLTRISLRPMNHYRVCARYMTMYEAGHSRIQLQKPASEKGHFQYSRDLSRDPMLKTLGIEPVHKGDRPFTFLTRRLGHAYELYPLIFIVGSLGILMPLVFFWSFSKIEIWLDKSQTLPPTDWERIRENYYKKPTLFFDPEGKSHRRLPIMEQLEDEMVDAAKKIGHR